MSLRGAVLLLCLSSVGRAQRLTGTVHDPVGQPVTSAAITLVSASGASLDRTVTDRQGTFVLPVAPTARVIQVRRIGFLPIDMPVPDSAHAMRATLDLSMRPIPRVLDPIVVVDATCPRNATAGEAAAFWEQARAGFLASVVARESAPAVAEMLHVVRSADARDQPGRIAIDAQHAVSTRPIVAARSPETFVALGYVQDSAGARFFYGPDADVLADPSFQGSHCFSMAKADRAHPGQIGIAFAPANGREKNSDISGVLWLDRTPLALHELEFLYVGTDPVVEKARGGGHLVFRTAENGVIVVGEYGLRMPEVGPGPSRVPRGLGIPTRLQVSTNIVTAIQTTGGVLVDATWPDGTVLRTSLPAVRGRVVDAPSGRGLPNIDVAIPWTSYHARSGPDGAFTLSNVLPGQYPITAVDSSLANFGIIRSHAGTIQIDTSQRQAGKMVTLALDAPMTSAEAACGSNRVGSGKSVMAIRVVDASGSTIRSKVRISYQNLSTTGTVTLVSGDWPFVLCGLSMGRYALNASDDRATRASEGETARSGLAHLSVSGRPEIDTVTIVLGHGPGGMI